MRAHVNIGSNLPPRKQSILRAISSIEQLGVSNVRISDFIETAPWGFSSPNKFLNVGVSFDTDMAPERLLRALQSVEREISGGAPHRNADGSYRDRLVDIDIIIYGDMKISSEELTIPHPRAAERDFVLKPLGQIDPSLLKVLDYNPKSLSIK